MNTIKWADKLFMANDDAVMSYSHWLKNTQWAPAVPSERPQPPVDRLAQLEAGWLKLCLATEFGWQSDLLLHCHCVSLCSCPVWAKITQVPSTQVCHYLLDYNIHFWGFQGVLDWAWGFCFFSLLLWYHPGFYLYSRAVTTSMVWFWTWLSQ